MKFNPLPTKVQDNTFKVYWYVFATREVINTDVEKNNTQIIGNGPYTFIKNF